MKLNKDLNGRIAVFMQDYMKTHGLAQGGLSKALGYKSVTSVVRLLKGRVAYVAVADCLKRFASLPMTESEANVYQQLCHEDLSLVKHDQWISILNRSSIDPGAGIHLNNRLETISMHLVQSSQLRIRLFGCVVPAMTAELMRLLKLGAEVNHFIRIDDAGRSVASILDASLPLYFYSNYNSSLYDAGANEIISGFTGDDLMLCSYTDIQGQPKREMIVMTDPTHAFTVTLDPATNIDTLADFASHHRKIISFSNNHRQDYGSDIIAYMNYIIRLEQNVPIRHIKPDLAFAEIPIEIIKESIRPDLAEIDKEIATLAPLLIELMRQRWANNQRNLCPQYHVVKRSAMELFFATGRLSDHPWMIRPFTVEERKAILEHLIRQQSQNSAWHMLFLKDDSLLLDTETALYGRTGVCFMRPGTDYVLTGDRTEILICRKRVMDSFTAFFDEALLGSCTMTEEESLNILLSYRGKLENM